MKNVSNSTLIAIAVMTAAVTGATYFMTGRSAIAGMRDDPPDRPEKACRPEPPMWGFCDSEGATKVDQGQKYVCRWITDSCHQRRLEWHIVRGS